MHDTPQKEAQMNLQPNGQLLNEWSGEKVETGVTGMAREGFEGWS
jgi:hypothetical protein